MTKFWNIKVFFDRLENIVGKGENAFFFSGVFPLSTRLSKAMFPSGIKSRNCLVKD